MCKLQRRNLVHLLDIYIKHKQDVHPLLLIRLQRKQAPWNCISAHSNMMALHTQFPLVQRYKTCRTTNTLSCALDDLPKTLEEKIVFMYDCRRVGQDNKLSRGGRRYNTSRHSAHVGKCDVISKTGSTQHIATPTDEDRVTATSSTHKQFLIKFGPVVSGDMLADRQTRSSQYSAPDERVTKTTKTTYLARRASWRSLGQTQLSMVAYNRSSTVVNYGSFPDHRRVSASASTSSSTDDSTSVTTGTIT